MKGFCLLLFSCFLATYGFCREPDHFDFDALMPDVVDDLLSVEDVAVTPQYDYKESKYWGRYTALRTAGWITFGTGVGFFIGGYAMILGAWATDSDIVDGLGVAGSLMLLSAPVLVLTSIPLLACAYYNRSKAKKMYLNVGASVLPTGGTTPFKSSTPALSFALTF